MQKKVEALEKIVARQRKHIELLRNKFFYMQEAIIEQHKNNILELNKNISPVEMEDNRAKVTIIAFSGMLTSLAMPKAEFFRSLHGADNANIIFLKDFKQIWYQNGLLGLTSDVEETVHYLRTIIPNTTEKIVTLGTSSGGFAAILFGSLLEAEASISFSPQTFLDKEEFRHFKSLESKWSDIEK